MSEVKARGAGTAFVVIPALNEERAIRAVVVDALAQCANVIVVDDGSSDGTSAVIADLPVERIRHEHRWQGAGLAGRLPSRARIAPAAC